MSEISGEEPSDVKDTAEDWKSNDFSDISAAEISFYWGSIS